MTILSLESFQIHSPRLPLPRCLEFVSNSIRNLKIHPTAQRVTNDSTRQSSYHRHKLDAEETTVKEVTMTWRCFQIPVNGSSCDAKKKVFHLHCPNADGSNPCLDEHSVRMTRHWSIETVTSMEKGKNHPSSSSSSLCRKYHHHP